MRMLLGMDDQEIARGAGTIGFAVVVSREEREGEEEGFKVLSEHCGLVRVTKKVEMV